MKEFRILAWATAIVAIATLGQWLAKAQQPTTKAQPVAQAQPAPADKRRFEFDVVSSFDEKYDGDTPGHLGRNGGLGERRPHVALGDPVFRGEQQVGTATTLTWSRAQGSLEVEFDPAPGVRIRVGDTVWLWLDGPPPKGE